ncbi:hypothetical protein ILUMI_07087 [Ignelater luminosus]|uniref:C2H2-type domain-containing protein n=1 Tax=Ignelater luminosus TaxID=2038154 RepID=A0A8K0GIE2_IGNLU|nr:hypothetical protein ILUMI_07087 [Ignelater luminosus]
MEIERRLNESKQIASNNNNITQPIVPKPTPVVKPPGYRKITMSKCKYCNKYVETRLLVTHVHQEHKEQIIDIPPLRRRDKPKKTFKCPECDKTFLKKANYLKHTRTHIPKFKCEHCDKSFFKKSILARHLVKVHNLRQTSLCYICGKTVSAPYLYVHLKTHTCKKSVRCPIKDCNSILKYKSSIPIHIRRTHVTEKSFICEHCGKLFAAKESLRLHLMSHETNYRYFCNICEKGFYLRSRLKRHHYSHQQEKRYRCPLCPQVFTFQQSIRKHCVTFHPDHPLAANPPPYLCKNYVPINSAEKRFKCSICRRRFTYEHSVKIHNRRFHPFSL